MFNWSNLQIMGLKDLEAIQVPQPLGCQTSCGMREQCIAFVLAQDLTCWMKMSKNDGTVPRLAQKFGMKTGIKKNVLGNHNLHIVHADSAGAESLGTTLQPPPHTAIPPVGRDEGQQETRKQDRRLQETPHAGEDCPFRSRNAAELGCASDPVSGKCRSTPSSTPDSRSCFGRA